jgi:hypothetical protein
LKSLSHEAKSESVTTVAVTVQPDSLALFIYHILLVVPALSVQVNKHLSICLASAAVPVNVNVDVEA